MEKLHSGAKWVFRFNVYRNILGVLIFFFIFSMVLSFSSKNPVLFILYFIFLIVVVILTEVYVVMAYNRYLFEFTHDEVKIESGVIWKKYTSIPYERIQNVDIKRGIIARMFGFSRIDLETAGRSSGGFGGWKIQGRNQEYKSEGYLPAISVQGADKIREFVMKKISKKGRAQGL